MLLTKKGCSFYFDTELSGEVISAEGPYRCVLIQDYIEASNVNVVKEMLCMLEVNRSNKAKQKTIQFQDTMIRKLWKQTVHHRQG